MAYAMNYDDNDKIDYNRDYKMNDYMGHRH